MKANFEITHKGKTYQLDKDYWKGQMINDSIDFQYEQLMHCMETGDFDTLKNRLASMIMWGGIIEIK